jgi:hypothetical protein
VPVTLCGAALLLQKLRELCLGKSSESTDGQQLVATKLLDKRHDDHDDPVAADERMVGAAQFNIKPGAAQGTGAFGARYG